MERKEILHYWNYFRSLCDRLAETEKFISHKAVNNEFIHGNVYSWEFQQLLFLSSMEFESISKMICSKINPDFNLKKSNIMDITRTILSRFPNIGQTEIDSDYQQLFPLQNWKIGNDSTTTKEVVLGIEWWDDYNILKHGAFSSFEKATLRNSVNSMASLMVLEMYLQEMSNERVSISGDIPCSYFKNKYENVVLGCCSSEKLPDFKS